MNILLILMKTRESMAVKDTFSSESKHREQASYNRGKKLATQLNGTFQQRIT